MVRFIGGIGKAGERVVLVPHRIRHLHLTVVSARRERIFPGAEGKLRPAKGVVLPKCPLGMALGPEDPPARRALGARRLHEFIDGAFHPLDLEREREHEEAVLALWRIHGQELHLHE